MKRKHLARRDWVIPRPRLNELLAAGLEYPLVTVVAGPGYGKTTAVMEFCRDAAQKLVWLHLLPPDNEPGCFWSSLLGALKPELPRLAQALAQVPFPGSPDVFEHFLQILRENTVQGAGVLCVLDCAECIDSDEVRLFVDNLLKAERKGLCLIFVSNKRVQIQSLIGSGRHFQIGAGELRFNEPETRQLFESYGHALTPDKLGRIGRLTDGWPLALHLIASQPDKPPEPGYGETPHFQVIAELFEQRYFACYEKPLQDLLVKLSFFPQAAPGLIQAIGAPDIAKTVGDLAKIIFISYDYNTHQYRFQQMYRDFLSLRQETLPQGEVTRLLSSAGKWFAQNGFLMDALECFWKIQDYDACLEIALAQAAPAQAAPEQPWAGLAPEAGRLLLDKLNRFPPGYRISHGEVDYCSGLVYLRLGRLNEARELLRELMQRLPAEQTLSEEGRTLLKNTYAALADISFMQNRADTLYYIEKTLSLSPETHMHPKPPAPIGNNGVFFLENNRPGAFEKAEAFNAAFAAYGGRGYSLLFSAEALFFRQRFSDAADQSLCALHAAREGGRHDIAANAYYLQIRIALFLGDSARAESILGELCEWAGAGNDPALAAAADCAAAMFYLRMRNPAKAPATFLAPACPAPPNAGRERIIGALRCFLAGDVEGAYALLLELDEVFAERNLWGVRATATIFRAVCLLRMGDRERAVKFFWRACDMTRQNGVIICFAEFGAAVAPLLGLARSHKEYLFEPDWLDLVQKQAAEYARREEAMLKRYGSALSTHRNQAIALTAREREVMLQLAQGLTREDISALLGISLHGVKKHITNIYNKLGAINRVDAIQIAMASGILEAN